MDELDILLEQATSRPSPTVKSEEFLNLVEQILDEVYDHHQNKRLVEQEESGAVTTKPSAKEFLLTLPKFAPNEAWGRPDSLDREVINKIFAVVGGGASIEEKISFIQQLASPDNKIRSPRRIISTLIILESLASVINSFSASAGGFVFEGFISALLRGKQEAEVTAQGNLPIQDVMAFSELGGGTPVSLKLLNKTTGIHGSYTNLINALDEFGQMTYLVARKSGDEILLEEFTLTRDNFIDAITSSATGGRTKEAQLFKLPNKTVDQSMKYIKSLASWPEQHAVLTNTLGFQGPSKDLSSPDTSEEPPAEEESGEINEASGKTQWSISPKQLPTLQGVNYKELGALPYSTDRIEKIAEMHMDKLNSSLFELFEATKDLSDNVNNYFTYEKRGEAIQSGEEAIKDSIKVQDSMRQEIASDQED